MKVQFFLIVDNKKFAFPISLGEVLTIGRGESVQVKINHPGVSTQHAKLDFDITGISITDLNSKNGTFLNNVRIQSQKICRNDQIRIGKSILLIDQESIPSEARPLIKERKNNTDLLNDTMQDPQFLNIPQKIYAKNIRSDRKRESDELINELPPKSQTHKNLVKYITILLITAIIAIIALKK